MSTEEQGLPTIANWQYTNELSALLSSSAEPHKHLLELLETNGWPKELVVEWLQAESRKPASESDAAYRRKCVRSLDAVVKKFHVFPSSFFVKDIQLDGFRPKKRGGFADIYKGKLGTQLVCLKLLRMYLNYDQRKRNEIITDFCKEMLIWTQLSHPNILPLIGVNSDLFEPEFCLVSPWITNDNIISFLKNNPNHDRLQPICDVAAGLEYLHSLSPVIVHGDVKGGNVLVDENYNCVLSDFGLSKTITQTTGITTSTSAGGSVRWMAPELFNYDVTSAEKLYTPARDIYAFGCTILEIMTGKPPFPDLHDGAVIHQLVNNQARPARPTDGWCPDNVWNLVTACWHEELTQRPRAGSINAYLSGLKEGVETERVLLLLHLISTPEKSLGVAETVNLLIAMGYSRYDVHEQMHKHNNASKVVLPILKKNPHDAVKSGVLFYTSIAATTVNDSNQTYVYYQIPSGEIVETRNNGLEARPIFRAALFTPLAVITYSRNGVDEARVYYVDQHSILQEHCRSGHGPWEFGHLGDLKNKASYNTSLAAICWEENQSLQIRVFYQDFDSHFVRGVGGESSPSHAVSWSKRRISISNALSGTALAAIRFERRVPRIRIYYQDTNLYIREMFYNESLERWHHGEFKTYRAPSCTPISATGWSTANLRVWARNEQGEIIGGGWRAVRDGGWRSLGVLASGVKPGTNMAAVATWLGPNSGGYDGQPTNKVYYQNPDPPYNVVEVPYDDSRGHLYPVQQ